MNQNIGPEKINIEQNNLGINFTKSKLIKRHLSKSSFSWKNEITSGPLINDNLTIYVNSTRLRDIIELESLKIINNIEKNLGFSVNSVVVQLQNNQQ